MTGGVAAIHAYLADTSNESNRCVRKEQRVLDIDPIFVRSRIFSLNLGLVFTGIALGPTLGSLLIRFTGQALSVFYLGGTLHLLYSCLVWFIIPESLTKSHMALAKTRYADSLGQVSLDNDHDRGFVAVFLRNAQRLFSFLRPLAILGPIEEVNGNPLKGRRKDWSLTLLAVAYGFTVALMVSLYSHYLYSSNAKLRFKRVLTPPHFNMLPRLSGGVPKL